MAIVEPLIRVQRSPLCVHYFLGLLAHELVLLYATSLHVSGVTLVSDVLTCVRCNERKTEKRTF